MQVGHIAEIWRYPVKSMGGERIESSLLDANGILGDRGWAVRDREADETRSARQIPRLLQCAASYAEEPAVGRRSPRVSLSLPGDVSIDSEAEDLHERISAAIEREVSLTPLHAADDLEHYRRAPGDPNVDPMAVLRELLGMEEDDPMPDLSGLPQDLRGFSTPPGTYFDCYPLHVMSTASLASLSEYGGGDDVDVRRFRPNILIDTGDATGLPEVEWAGRRLRIGGATVDVKTTTVRCAVPSHRQRGFESSRAVGRALIEHTKQHLGAYANVLTPATVSVGDVVELLD